MSAMAFADDLVLVSDTYEGLRSLVVETEDYLSNIGLSINPQKSQYFGWRPNHRTKGFDYSLDSIQVSGMDVQPVLKDQPMKYLGLYFFVNKAPAIESEKANKLLDLIGKASLKPFQKLHCWRQLVQPAYLYGASNSLQVQSEAGRLDRVLSKHVKAALHLPQGFPNSHIWMPTRCGGLGMLQLQRVAMVTHYKALTRLVRLGDDFVDQLFDEVLGACRVRIGTVFETSPDITEASQVKTALKKGSVSWWKRQTARYQNQDLFAHKCQFTANSWLAYDSKQLKDGDRIRALRLRTNLYPTRTLSNKHATDPTARLCRRCNSRPETAFHILQECPSVHLPRTERHNFIAKNVVRMVKERRPQAVVHAEKLLVTKDHIRLKPDLIVEEGNQVTIVDFAVTWDANEGILIRMCAAKRAKYAALKDLFPGKTVQIFGMAFGARSMLCRETVRAGESLGLTKRDVGWLSVRTLLGSIIVLGRFAKLVRA